MAIKLRASLKRLWVRNYKPTQQDFADLFDSTYFKADEPNVVQDASYVHTDNNYTTTDKNKVSTLVVSLNSPAFTGTPTAPTATQGTNTTQIATTQYVKSEIVATTPNTVDISTVFASPSFTGTPIAPTATVGTNTTQLATTAFVLANSSSGSNFLSGINALGSVTKGMTLGLTNPGAETYTMVDGTAYFSLIYLDGPMTITGVRLGQSTAGSYTADNFNGIALYSVSGSTFTKVAESANITDLWTTSYWYREIPLSSAYNVTEKGLYAIGLLYNSSVETTAPVLYAGSLHGSGGFTALGLSYTFYSTLAAQNTLPASVTATTNTHSYIPVILTVY